MDTIYENIDQIPDLEIRGASRVQSLLSQYKENAYQSRMLATINTKAPLNLDIAESEFWDFEKKEVVENLTELELMSLIKRIPTKEDKQETILPKINGEYRCVNNETMINLLEKLVLNKKFFSFDTETTSLNPFEAELVGISISTDTETGWYIPVNHSIGENISTQNLAKIKRLFEDPAIEKYAHNANYDLSVLVNNNFEVNNLSSNSL